MPQQELVDRYGRQHNYLRLSVTDRCNLRCFYCMGPNGVPLLDRGTILKYEEILEIVKVGSELGISRVRITGGEPLVRKNLAWLVREIRKIAEIEDLSLTTNGILLGEYAQELRDAGLDRVNISLDTLTPETYAQITRGGVFERVLEGIESAIKVGLFPVKMNVVLIKGVNDQEVPQLLQFAYNHPVQVRFIEYMALGGADNVGPDYFLPLEFVLKTASASNCKLKPPPAVIGNGTAETFSIIGGKGSIGLIHPVSRHFCAACNRLRLTADGFIKPCLYWQEEFSVKPALGNPEKIRVLFFQAVGRKRQEHQMGKTDNLKRTRSMSKIGG
jgi:cyclic pyranopterin phosphate synthase